MTILMMTYPFKLGLVKFELVAKMSAQRLFLLTCLPTLITGCAQLYTTQTPAPVFQGGGMGAQTYPQPAYPTPVSPRPRDDKPGDIDIKPLPSSPDIKPTVIEPELLPTEQNLLTLEQEQELAALESAQQQPASDQTPNAPAANANLTLPPEAPPTPPPPSFEPLQTFGPLSPAIGALVLAANKSTGQGNIDSATTAIERAIRIEPRNAALYYKLALLRLEQDKPRLAEGLAKKSALLAASDKQLKKHSWLLIAKARDMQNNPEGAKEARAQADKY